MIYAERLSQQFGVDQYVKTESERILFLRLNQNKLRAADYTHLRDMIGDSAILSAELDAVRAGILFILPSTYIGSKRYMR